MDIRTLNARYREGDMRLADYLQEMLATRKLETGEALAKALNANRTSHLMPSTDAKEAQRWIDTGTIPDSHIAQVQVLLGRERDPDFAQYFSPGARTNHLICLLNKAYLKRDDEFGQLMSFAALISNDNLGQFARKLELYAFSMRAILEGHIIPSDRIIENICGKLGFQQQAVDKAKKLAKDDREGERQRLCASPDAQRLTFIASIMADVDAHTHIGPLVKRLLDTPGTPFIAAHVAQDREFTDQYLQMLKNSTGTHTFRDPQRLGQLAQSFMLTPLYEQLFVDVGMHNLPGRKSFEKCLREYIAPPKRGKTKERTAQGFIDFFAKEQLTCREELQQRWKTTHFTLTNAGKRDDDDHVSKSQFIASMIEREQLHDFDLQQEVYSLMRGQPPYMTLDELCDAAQAVLLCDAKNGPPAEILKDNPVYADMVQKGFLLEGGMPDKEKMTCSLSHVLKKKRGLSERQIEERSNNWCTNETMQEIYSGRRTITLCHTADGHDAERPAGAKRMAGVYAGEEKKRDRLGLLLQNIAHKRTPKDWLKDINAGTMTAGQALHEYRRQNYLSPEEMAALVITKGGCATPIALSILRNVEKKGGCIRNPEAAKALATTIDFIPDTEDFRHYCHFLRGNIDKIVTRSDLDALVDEGLKPGSSVHAGSFIKPVQNHLHVNSARKLAALLTTPSGAHLSTDHITSWSEGKPMQQRMAEDMAKLAGFDGARRTGFINIATGKSRTYNPHIVEDMEAGMPITSRSLVMLHMRLNTKKTPAEMAKTMGVTKEEYIALESGGAALKATAQTQLEDAYRNFAEATIPDEHAQQREAFVKAMISEPQQASAMAVQ